MTCVSLQSNPYPDTYTLPTITASVALVQLATEVVRIIDSDAVDVVLSGESENRVRLLGNDTPETFGANTPTEYEDITDTAYLDNWGPEATELT